MSVYQLGTILLIFSLTIFPEQFNNLQVKSLIVVLSICLLPFFFKSFQDDLKRRFAPTLCFLVFLAISSVISVIFINKVQNFPQILLFFSYFIIFISLRGIFPTLKHKEQFSFCFLILTSILSLISIYHILILHYINNDSLSFLWVYRGHNHLSALLIFAIPLIIYFLKTYWHIRRMRFVSIVLGCLLMISLLLSLSIGAMLALATSFLLAIFMFKSTVSFKNFPLKKTYFMIFLIVALLSVSTFLYFSETKGVKAWHLRKNPLAHVQARFVYWQVAFENFGENPLTGIGFGSFNQVLNEYGNLGKAANTTEAHNFFIQMLSDTGIFGFLSSVALIGAVIGKGYKAVKTASAQRESLFYLSLFVGILASTLVALIDFNWSIPVVFLFFWIFSSFLTNYANRGNHL